MSTLGHDDIAAGKGKLWPVREVITHPGSWADPEERIYRLQGDEFWDDYSNDHNEVGTITTREFAERIVACYNAFYGIPTSEITARITP